MKTDNLTNLLEKLMWAGNISGNPRIC